MGGARVGQVLPVLEVGEPVASQAVDVEHRSADACAGGVAAAAEVDRVLAVAAFGDEPGRLARGQRAGRRRRRRRERSGGRARRRWRPAAAPAPAGRRRRTRRLPALARPRRQRYAPGVAGVWQGVTGAWRVPRQNATGVPRSASPASVPSRIASSNDRGPSASPARTTSAPASCSAANSADAAGAAPVVHDQRVDPVQHVLALGEHVPERGAGPVPARQPQVVHEVDPGLVHPRQVHVALVLVHGLAEGDGAGHQAHRRGRPAPAARPAPAPSSRRPSRRS